MFAAILSLVQKIYNVLVGSVTTQLTLIESQTSMITPGGSVVKSMQTGSISIGGSSLTADGTTYSNTATITAVDITKAFLVFQGVSGISISAQVGFGTPYLSYAAGGATLTSSTVVTGYISAAVVPTNEANFSGVVYFTVIEYN